jgi:hypothetical protein
MRRCSRHTILQVLAGTVGDFTRVKICIDVRRLQGRNIEVEGVKKVGWGNEMER